MRNNLTILDNQLTITSKQLCDIINMFREQEENSTVLMHKNLMASIRAELEVLANAGIEGGLNFEPSSYVDSQGKERPCYNITKAGAMSILNKESAVVRFRTQQYIDTLEKQLMAQMLPSNNNNNLIGINPYSNRLIRKNINQLRADDIPRYVNQVVEQAKEYKASDRLNTYELTRSALEDLLPTMTDSFDIEMVQAPLRKLNKLIENQKMYISRSKLGSSTKKINNLEQRLDEWIQYTEQLEQQIDELIPPERVWTTLLYHPFSENYQYDKNYHITKAYRYWRNNFPRDLVPTKEQYETYQDINFDAPICIEIKLVHMEKFDTSNFIKSLLDMIFYDILGVDDKIVTKIIPETVGYCDSYDEGEISFCIYNI
jgi:hypothetical protein